MVEHSTLTGADLHEPKGVAAASDGQLYIANGTGSGAWEDNPINVHGEMDINSNTTATSVTAAVDTSLATDSDYTKITAGWSSSHVVGISFNVDELVVPVDGDYLIHFWASIKVPLTNNFVGIKYSVNDTPPYSIRKLIAQSQSTNDYVNMAASGIVVGLSAGDTISAYIAATKTDNLIIQEGGLITNILHEV